MCFLKTLKPLESIAFDKEIFSDDNYQQMDKEDQQQEKSYLNQLLSRPSAPILSRQDQLLMNLMVLVSSNNSRLVGLDEKLKQSQQRLTQTHQFMDQLTQMSSIFVSFAEQSATSIDQSFPDSEETVVDPLVTKLFGKKKYAYKLQLQESLSDVIYKERNINLSVNLVDTQTQKILNANMVHLCLGVCDSNGQWITENRAGQNFMKGKTEVELYHGEAAFLKVYPRDVSRSYPEGKINFVLYSKPSLIQFSSSSSGVEQVVDSNLIEPLLIRDISIRAKKKD